MPPGFPQLEIENGVLVVEVAHLERDHHVEDQRSDVVVLPTNSRGGSVVSLAPEEMNADPDPGPVELPLPGALATDLDNLGIVERGPRTEGLDEQTGILDSLHRIQELHAGLAREILPLVMQRTFAPYRGPRQPDGPTTAALVRVKACTEAWPEDERQLIRSASGRGQTTSTLGASPAAKPTSARARHRGTRATR